MNSAKKVIKRAWQAPLWIFIALFLISASVSILALRHNNQTMIKLRDQVYAADKNNGDINGALNNLRDYVYAHMNTDLSSGGNTIKPPIQLKYTYERLVAAEEAQQDNQNSQIYTQAEDYCQHQDPTDFYGYYRVPCVENYLTTHGLTNVSISVPTALYKFDFVSPTWSPDLAGWSLLISSVLLLLVIIKLAASRLKQK